MTVSFYLEETRDVGFSAADGYRLVNFIYMHEK